MCPKPRKSGYKKLDFIIKAVKTKKKRSTILELGCGSGNIVMVLAALGYNVKGVDLSEKAILKANEKKKQFSLDNLILINKNIFEYEDSEKYDVVICSEVLEHLETPEIVLDKMKKLVKDDGILIVTIPNGWGPYEISFTPIRLYKRHFVPNDGSLHVQKFGITHAKKMFAKNGFTIINFGKSDFISAVMPMSLIIRKFSTLCEIDFKIADKLPSRFASGWYFLLRKTG